MPDKLIIVLVLLFALGCSSKHPNYCLECVESACHMAVMPRFDDKLCAPFFRCTEGNWRFTGYTGDVGVENCWEYGLALEAILNNPNTQDCGITILRGY